MQSTKSRQPTWDIRKVINFDDHLSLLLNKAISDYPGPDYSTGGHFGDMNVNYFYKKETQLETLGGILGSRNQAKKYISADETGDKYLGEIFHFSLFWLWWFW